LPTVGVRPQKLASASRAVRTETRAEPRGVTRISARRALSLALPGLLVLDAILVTGSFLAAIGILSARAGLSTAAALRVGPQLFALYGILVAGFLLLGGMFGLYERRSFFAPRRAMAAAARALFWSGAIAIVFAFLLALDPPGDLRVLLFTHAGFLALGVMTLRPLACRGLVRLAEVGAVHARRALILGTDDGARRVAAVLEGSSEDGFAIAGLASLGADADRGPHKWPRFRLEQWDDARELADALAADEVVIATASIPRAEAVLLANDLARAGLIARIVPHVSGMHVDGAPLERDSRIPMARLGWRPLRPFEWAAKRGFDLAVTVTGGLILLPLFLVIALAVRLNSRGPILYAQTRVGRGGCVFKMYKFRSMVVSNDDREHRQYVESLVREGSAAGTDAKGRPVYKILDDPRVTMVGRIIRAASMDELPQIWNVIRGEMSLVGPRPCLPFEYELYEDWQRLRLDVTPGITGVWQVSGRSLLSFEEMVLLDLYYVANWSFWLDLRVLWRTIPEVLYWRGVR
jgi:exopolysaccharide biosynthesis polyprenyl glycosylphosphotransferase